MTEKQKENQKLRKEAHKAKRTPEQNRAALRRKVRIFYDLQRLRLQTAGRTYDRATDIELHEADTNMLNNRASELEIAEKSALKDVEWHLKGMKAYTEILAEKPKYRGIGPTLAGVILSEIDIHRATTASALWKYCGLAPVKCRRCKLCNDTVVAKSGSYKHEFKRKKKCKLDIIPESDTFESGRAERPTTGIKLPYNSFLKMKLVGVMADCLIKSDSPFRSFYDDYKHRLQSADKGMSDGHRHRMALRYMVKMVLLEIWKSWRELEGLEVRVTYQEEYLNHKHG